MLGGRYGFRAEKIDPQSAAPFVHRIEAYARLGRHEQAEVMFYMAQQVAPDDAGAYVALADSLMQRGMHDRAAWCLRRPRADGRWSVQPAVRSPLSPS